MFNLGSTVFLTEKMHAMFDYFEAYYHINLFVKSQSSQQMVVCLYDNVKV